MFSNIYFNASFMYIEENKGLFCVILAVHDFIDQLKKKHLIFKQEDHCATNKCLNPISET